MDLNLLCRLCGKEDRLCIQVFGTEGVKQSVAKKIRLCLPIVVKESDDYPKQICLNCLSNLDTSYELYNRCLEAQSVIKNLMMVNVQSRGELVKVYSTQEMLKMVNELKDKMCEKRPAIRLGNTVYTIREAGSQTEVSNSELRAKKRKHEEAAKAGGRGMVIPMAPLGQQYMLMPSATMPPSMMIPSGVPRGQFTIAPMPGIPTYPLTPIQAVPQTSISTAPVVQTNTAEIQTLIPEAPKVTKPTAAPSTKDIAVVVQSVQPGSTAKVQSKITAMDTSEPSAQPQITSIQSAIQAFQNSSAARITQPIISSQVNSAPIISQLPVSSSFALNSSSVTTLSPSVTEPPRSSVQVFQQTPLPEMVSLQTSTPVSTNQVANNQEESPSEILPLINNNVTTPVITKKSPRSSPINVQESSPQKSQSRSFMVNINEGGDDDDDDEYAADDPDPLHDDSEEEQDTTENNTADDTAAEKSTTEVAPEPELPTENRDETIAAVEELSSDGSVSAGQLNTHKCPYCNKSFPEDVIFHHKKLHFRQKFFSCITCNKNFRTEAGLECHRCE